MKPYYEDDDVTIYHGDCREILPTLEPVDLVLTDPPYMGMVGGYSFGQGSGVSAPITDSNSVGDLWNADLLWVPEIIRLAGKGCMVFASYHNLPEVAIAFAALRRVMLVTWHKRNAPHTGKNVPRFTEEYIWCFAQGVGLRWDSFSKTMLDIPKLATGALASPERFLNKDTTAVHPTQKPLAVMKALLSVGGETILDPFMGSGTTLRAAKDLGRKAIGIEIEERYAEIAAKRMMQSVMNLEDSMVQSTHDKMEDRQRTFLGESPEV